MYFVVQHVEVEYLLANIQSWQNDDRQKYVVLDDVLGTERAVLTVKDQTRLRHPITKSVTALLRSNGNLSIEVEATLSSAAKRAR